MGRVLNIRMGPECNHVCRFCTVAEDKENTLSSEEIKDLINQKDVSIVVFTGGEPTIRKDLPELMLYANSLGKSIELQTNGSNITDELFDVMVKTKVSHVMFSLHSHKKEIHKELSGVDDFDKIINNLKRLSAAKFYIAISHVINELNYKDLLDFTKFILKNIGNVKFYISFIRPNGRTKYYPELVPRLYKVQYHLYLVMEFLQKNNIEFEIEGVPLCYMLEFKEKSAEYRRNTLEVYKNQTYFSSTTKNKLARDIRENTKKRSPDCELCRMKNICPGMWKEYIEMFGSDELFPIF